MRKNNITTAEFGPELLLHHKETDEVHILNPTAKLLYTLHREGKSIREMETFLRQKYMIQEEESLVDQIKFFLKELENKGMT